MKLVANAAAIFVAVFAMGASIQATVSKAKAPYVHEKYRTLNTAEVCAYDTKCGDIQTFENKEAADAENYHTIVHCGICSGCSSWQDLSVQWNTRKDAAKLSQRCGFQHLFHRDDMAKCMRERMGWTTECSYAWVASVECAKQNCMFIAVTAMITNKLGNFAVSSDLVTPAMCNEAQCEQGNPGEFAKLSGASRRKMNIQSDIARPKDQQCNISSMLCQRMRRAITIGQDSLNPFVRGVHLHRRDFQSMLAHIFVVLRYDKATCIVVAI